MYFSSCSVPFRAMKSVCSDRCGPARGFSVPRMRPRSRVVTCAQRVNLVRSLGESTSWPSRRRMGISELSAGAVGLRHYANFFVEKFRSEIGPVRPGDGSDLTVDRELFEVFRIPQRLEHG